MEPSESVDPAELKSTVNGALPEDGVAFATATGAWLTLNTEMLTDATSVAPLSSITVKVAT